MSRDILALLPGQLSLRRIVGINIHSKISRNKLTNFFDFGLILEG